MGGILVEIYANRLAVQVEWPQCSASLRRTIVEVLNTALLIRFGLEPCIVTEGGVQGILKREPIELRNIEDEIGLMDEHRFSKNPQCQKVLGWYASTLHTLFEKTLWLVGENLGKGAILELSPQDPFCEKKVRKLLWAALFKKEGRKFADEVFGRLPASPHVTGLTDDQIVQYFVPPPIRK